MLKVKKHKIIKRAGFRVFKNIESLLIDRKDFADKLARYRRRFRRHDYHLIDLDKKLNELKKDRRTKKIGKMVKVRVKDFVLDAFDGRIYAVAVTFCGSGSKVQKQLEVEYSGYISSFPKFRMGGEKEVVTGVVALSKFIYKGSSDILRPSVERKFEFVKNNSK